MLEALFGAQTLLVCADAHDANGSDGEGYSCIPQSLTDPCLSTDGGEVHCRAHGIDRLAAFV